MITLCILSIRQRSVSVRVSQGQSPPRWPRVRRFLLLLFKFNISDGEPRAATSGNPLCIHLLLSCLSSSLYWGDQFIVSSIDLYVSVSQCAVKRSNVVVERFCGHTTENASRLGYKHVCVNYLHVASPDYQKVIQHTHTHPHTHSFTESFYFFSLYFHLSFNKNSSGEWKFQILLNQKNINHKHIISRQKKGLEDTKVRKANIAR